MKEVVESYLKLEDKGYWVKLCQLVDTRHIAIFNKLVVLTAHR